MVDGEKQPRGWHQRFEGFRLNCEVVPILPASIVRRVLEDPRNIPYLLVWKSRWDGHIGEAVRVARLVPQTKLLESESVEIKRSDGSAVPVYLIWRRQPQGGCSLLLRCWKCRSPRRGLYGARVGDDVRSYGARRADWECRRCAQLRYCSEGGRLLIRGSILSRVFGRTVAPTSFPRPEPWLPYVFTSPEAAGEAGLCNLS
jgi:hypothetical protein